MLNRIVSVGEKYLKQFTVLCMTSDGEASDDKALVFEYRGCGITFHYHFPLVPSVQELKYIFGSYLWVK